MPIAIGLIVLSWCVLIFGPSGLVPWRCAFAGLVLGAMLTGFCVQHDANHGAYFRSARCNHLLGWTADALLGFSSYAWRVKHNVAHHTYTNVDGYDDDITQMPFARLVPAQPRGRGTASSTSTSGRSTASWGCAGRRSATSAPSAAARSAQSRSASPRGWDLAGVLAGKAVFFTWALVIPLLVYPWWVVLVALRRRLARD